MNDSVEPEHYIAVALLEISKKLVNGISHHFDQLPKLLYENYSITVSTEVISSAVSMLAELRLARVTDDPLAGLLIRVSEEKLEAFQAQVSSEKDEYFRLANARGGSDPLSLGAAESLHVPTWDALRENLVLGRYLEFGSPFVNAAMEKFLEPDFDERLAAGSDRIVSFSENSEKVNQIREKLNDLETVIREDNEVGDRLGEQKEEVLGELADLKGAMSRNSGRVSHIRGLSQRFLTWLGKLVAKTSAETVVKHLTKLFMELVS